MTTTQPSGSAPPAGAARTDHVGPGTGRTDSVAGDEAAVLAALTGMIEQVLGAYELDDTEITMETRFGRDLELESIDLVTLAGLLQDRYGSAVNFAEFVASMELDEIIELSVGRLVEHVCLCLKAEGRD